MIEDLLSKEKLSEFSKEEFTILLEEIISAKGGEKYQDKLTNYFEQRVPHPDGMDLIFWAPDDEATPSAIIKKIDAYCTENGFPTFKN